MGRPPIYKGKSTPCEYCPFVVTTRQQASYHRDEYKLCPKSKGYCEATVQQQIREGKMTVQIVPFVAEKGIPADSMKLLNEIRERMEFLRQLAKKLRAPSVEEYIRVAFSEAVNKCDVTDLNKLKNSLGEKRLEFNNKQELVKAKVDSLLDECAMIYGEDIPRLLASNPDTAMEKMVINHIRQRSRDALKRSEQLTDAMQISIKQTIVFRECEDAMKEFAFIEELLDEYIRNVSENALSFVNAPGQFQTQQEVDDETTNA